jgi:hypothetical protein
MICSLVCSAVRSNIVYIGTKDGRVKIVDIDRGEAVKNMSCGGGAVIEMIVVEGVEEGGRGLVMCWLCKEKCFKIVDI